MSRVVLSLFVVIFLVVNGCSNREEKLKPKKRIDENLTKKESNITKVVEDKDSKISKVSKVAELPEVIETLKAPEVVEFVETPKVDDISELSEVDDSEVYREVNQDIDSRKDMMVTPEEFIPEHIRRSHIEVVPH